MTLHYTDPFLIITIHAIIIIIIIIKYRTHQQIGVVQK